MGKAEKADFKHFLHSHLFPRTMTTRNGMFVNFLGNLPRQAFLIMQNEQFPINCPTTMTSGYYYSV